MDKFNGLLLNISKQYHIYRGKSEDVNFWKMRIIYSICGMMGYASLFDWYTDGPVSKVHMTNRIKKTFQIYASMYPEILEIIKYSQEELGEEIREIFLNSGVAYHNSYRMTVSINRETEAHGVLFQRGIALDSIEYVSGIGFYNNYSDNNNDTGIREMFKLEQENLRSIWENLIKRAQWQRSSLPEIGTEYLRTQPSFHLGYWIDSPDITSGITLLRTGTGSIKIYYLYRLTDEGMELSQLPSWKVDGKQYFLLANACLSAHGTLPPISYIRRGALVEIKLGYLLPPREHNFLKLYSWPASFENKSYANFNRLLSTEIFGVFQKVLSEEGYEFKEVNINA